MPAVRTAILATTAMVSLAGCPLAMSNDYEIVDGAAGRVIGDSGAGAGGRVADAGSCDGCDGVCCDNVCVDTNTDQANCGSCGKACSPGRDCVFGQCQSGWVESTASPPTAFVPREKAAYAWTGNQVFIWGGASLAGAALDDGALYDPRTDQWSPVIKDRDTPSPRVLATAVAVGSSVIVWGGGDPAGSVDYNDGAAYDLLRRSWTELGAAGALPPAERAPVAWALGGEVVFWGGWDRSGLPVGGPFVYGLSGGGSWKQGSTGGGPGARSNAATGWFGSGLYVYGGQPNGIGKTDHASRYTLPTDQWSPLPNGPSQRYGSFGVWDGQAFFVWGGRDDNDVKNDGSYLQGNAWTKLDIKGAPAARWAPARQSGWGVRIAEGRMLVLGGSGFAPDTFMTDGGIYDRVNGSWTAVPSWPSGEDHAWGVGVWTGHEFVLWSGRDGSRLTPSLERFEP